MEGKTLRRGKGVSFDVIDYLTTLIISPDDLKKTNKLFEGAFVDVLYGKKAYRAVLLKNRGHEKYDIRYDIDRKVEAGVDISRITPIHTAFRIKIFGNVQFPFVCVPIRHREKCIGVLGVDTIEKNVTLNTSKNEYVDKHLVATLEQFGRIVGANVDLQQKNNSLKRLHIISKNRHSELLDTFDAIFEIIFTNLLYVVGTIATRFIYEADEHDKDKGLKVLSQRGDIPSEVLSKMKSFNLSKCSLKVIQKHGDKVVWLFCKQRPEVRGGQGQIFIITLVHKVPITEPDYEFLTTLQRIVLGTLQTIISQKASSEVRYEALKDIQHICDTWMLRTKKKLFHSIVESVQSCFYSANMYYAALGLYNLSLEYVLASTQSNMLGNVLYREDQRVTCT
jgi:hypothetical protein